MLSTAGFLVFMAGYLLHLSMQRICIEKSLSTISWDRLRRPFMALGSTMIRTKVGHSDDEISLDLERTHAVQSFQLGSGSLHS